MKNLDITLSNGKPVFSWCPELEQGAIDQIKVIASLPFVEHFAIMPDCHIGDTAPIGSVIATNNVILPFAVGTDAGCGVCAIKTNLSVKELDEFKEMLHSSVENEIPFGFSHNTDKRRNMIEEKYGHDIDSIFEDFNGQAPITNRKDIASQIGSLGGG